MKNPAKLRAMTLVALITSLILIALFAPREQWVAMVTRPEAWHGPDGVLLFVLVYVVWNFVLPPAPLQALAGAYYGFTGGLAVILVSTAIANVMSHAVAHWLGRSWVKTQIEQSTRLSAVEQAVEKLGWKGVALLRLSNLIPSNLANLFMGVTTLRLPTILAASILGSLPGWALMLTLGRGGIALIGGPGLSTLEAAIYAISGIAALGLLIGLGWYARKILQTEPGARAAGPQEGDP